MPYIPLKRLQVVSMNSNSSEDWTKCLSYRSAFSVDAKTSLTDRVATGGRARNTSW